MDVFIETAAKHFVKNPTSETTEMILLLGDAIQKQLSKVKDSETQTSPQKEMLGVKVTGELRGMGRGLMQRCDGQFCPKNEFLWIGDTREEHREEHIEPISGVSVAALNACEAEEIYEDAEEKNYENDKDTLAYLETFGDLLGEKYPPNPDWFGENKTYFFPWNCPKGYWQNRKYFNEDDPEDVGLVHNILQERKEFYENASPKVYRCWRAATILANEQGIGSLSELRKRGYTDVDIYPLWSTQIINYSNDKIMLLRKGDSDFFQLNGYFW